MISILNNNFSKNNQTFSFTYDAWGKLPDTTGNPLIGMINPIRYRGYYYDMETCRFINADGVIAGVGGDLQGYNRFVYCFNNPVNMEDETGH